jgi:hypothetical protein
MICASCHQAGHCRKSRDLNKHKGEKHEPVGNGFSHTQFSLRLRFWTKADLTRMSRKITQLLLQESPPEELDDHHEEEVEDEPPPEQPTASTPVLPAAGRKRAHSEVTSPISRPSHAVAKTTPMSKFGELDATALAVTRSSLLAAHPVLRDQHEFLVKTSETVTEDGFWSTNQDLVQEEHARCGMTRAGTSSSLQEEGEEDFHHPHHKKNDDSDKANAESKPGLDEGGDNEPADNGEHCHDDGRMSAHRDTLSASATSEDESQDNSHLESEATPSSHRTRTPVTSPTAGTRGQEPPSAPPVAPHNHVSQVAALEKMRFFRGVVKVEALNRIGEVYDVDGDGNCGFHCLLLALYFFVSLEHQEAPALTSRSSERPTDQLSMRKLIQRLALVYRDAMFDSVSQILYFGLDEDSRLGQWEASLIQLFQEDIPYDSDAFMKKQKKNRYVNQHHWMEDTIVLPIFSRHYRLRVYVYNDLQGGDLWHATVYDGREGTFKINHYHCFVEVDQPDDKRTFGTHYDGEHCQHTRML